MNGQMKSSNIQMMGPYSTSEIPKFDIDYSALIAYARSKCKRVADLSDDEKNLFIHNATIADVRKKALH